MGSVLTILLQIVLLAIFVIGGYLLRFYNLRPIRIGIISGVLSIILILFVFICLVPNNIATDIIGIFYYLAFQLALAGFIFAMFGIKHDTRRQALSTMSEKEIRNLSNMQQQERLYGVLTILCCLIIMFFIAISSAIVIKSIPLVINITRLCVIYVTVLAVVAPLVIGYALKGYQFWNGLLSLVLFVIILFVISVLSLRYPNIFVDAFGVGVLCLLFPTLLALYSQMYDDQKIFSIVTLSAIAFIPLVLFNVLVI
jgi:hypothetical protein